MFTIELLLKGNPAPLSVQRKEEDSAHELYQMVMTAVRGGESKVLELSCDRTQKKVFVLSQEIVAAQLTPKAGSAGTVGSRPGFFAQVDPA